MFLSSRLRERRRRSRRPLLRSRRFADRLSLVRSLHLEPLEDRRLLTLFGSSVAVHGNYIVVAHRG